MFNKKNRVIENVAVMGLNVQPENVLSKEERKARLGGRIGSVCPEVCYAFCRNDSRYVKSCDPYDTKPVCDHEPVEYCWCWPDPCP